MMQDLKHFGWDVNARDYDGRTAAHIAASEGHLNAMKYLVAYGADLSILDSRGNDPIEDATREKRYDVEVYLREVADTALIRTNCHQFEQGLLNKGLT